VRFVIEPALKRGGPGPFLLKFQQNSVGQSVGEPMHTVMAGATRFGLCSAFISKYFGDVIGHGMDQPLGTVTARDHNAIAIPHLTSYYGTGVGSSVERPIPTITGQGAHHGLVAALLVKYYNGSNQAQSLTEPLHTIVQRARFGLVVIPIAGQDYVLSDIRFRMLRIPELAAAQGFGPDYEMFGTQEEQQRGIGNSVCSQVAEALLDANLPPLEKEAA
jgi:DNA (cytosine-5)-methyltransferase 1